MQLTVQSNQTPLSPASFDAMTVGGLYVHIPFCFHKCHYCDFYSITRQTPDRMNRFVDLILQEADQWTRSPITLAPRTAFFGGGTPSLLPIDQMARLITGLRDRFDFAGLDEWTVEVNPATASVEYFQRLLELGVNRISMGGQSFNREELKTLERHHDPQDVIDSVAQARQAGFVRLNVDLIYAIPGQSLESWSQSLEAVIALNTTHVSCYALTYEPNTAMTARKNLGEFVPCEDSMELTMMRHTRKRLSDVGISAYEISNYSTPGQECRHNLLYWTGGNYISLGPSAASHVEGTRWKNRPNLGDWENVVAADALPAMDVERLSTATRTGEWMMLQLRLTRGVNFAEYTARTGGDARRDYAGQLERLIKHGLITINAQGFALSDGGLSLADAIAAEFLHL